MTPEQFKALKPGDFVRHKSNSKTYIVHSNYGDRVTAARTVDMTNPSEWELPVEFLTQGYYKLEHKDGEETVGYLGEDGRWSLLGSELLFTTSDLSVTGEWTVLKRIEI